MLLLYMEMALATGWSRSWSVVLPPLSLHTYMQAHIKNLFPHLLALLSSLPISILRKKEISLCYCMSFLFSFHFHLLASLPSLFVCVCVCKMCTHTYIHKPVSLILECNTSNVSSHGAIFLSQSEEKQVENNKQKWTQRYPNNNLAFKFG